MVLYSIGFKFVVHKEKNVSSQERHRMKSEIANQFYQAFHASGSIDQNEGPYVDEGHLLYQEDRTAIKK